VFSTSKKVIELKRCLLELKVTSPGKSNCSGQEQLVRSRMTGLVKDDPKS
jgi:hypothetical protein